MATPPSAAPPAPPGGEPSRDEPISDQLEAWTRGDGEHTVGGLIDVFGEKSFALLFVVLLAVPALPLPTGGATHVFEIITIIVAAQLVVGRHEIWIPQRWRGLSLGGSKQQKFVNGLLRFIRFLERFSRPRLAFLFGRRSTNAVCGVLIIVCTVGAFLAPPFSGLDTIPALGGVLIALGMLLEDILLVLLGTVVGAGGILLEIILGKAAASQFKKII